MIDILLYKSYTMCVCVCLCALARALSSTGIMSAVTSIADVCL